MSDNKALVIITSIIFTATTIFFLVVVFSPLFIKPKTKDVSGMLASSPKFAANQGVTRGVLGDSILRISRNVQLDGTAWINGNLYLEKGSTLHLGDIDVSALLSTAKNQTTTIVQQPITQTTQEINQNGVLSLQSQTGDITLISGEGITLSGLTITNDDPGSAQDIFKTISAGGLSFSAATNKDILTFSGGNGITVGTTNGNTVTIASTIENPSISINTGAGLSGGGTVLLGNVLSLNNSGVLSITGTANQIITSSASGNLMLSLPQNINATASPIFAGLSLSGVATTSGNITFQNASSRMNILNGGTLGFYTSAGGDGGLAVNPSLFIAGNGKVGIGTNNPGTNALQVNGGSLYVNGSSNSIIADGIVRSNTLFWMSNGNSGVSSILRLENFNANATGLSLSAKLAGSDGSETEWPYQTIIKDTTWTGTSSTRNSAITFNTLFNNASKEVLRLASTGFVGVGTTSPLATLDLRSQSGTLAIASISGKTSFSGLVIDNSGTGSLFTASNAGQTKFVIDNQGNTRMTSSLCVKVNNNSPCSGSTPGTIYATNQAIQNADYAEDYISSQHLSPGDIVMMANDGNNNAIIRTDHAYQQETIGVVSTAPGVTLNSNAQEDLRHPYLYPIALSGRVPVTVSTENGSIHAGDFITTSSKVGIGMRATKEGIVIGKALENFDGSHGSIGQVLVYINVSWANPQIMFGSTGLSEITSSTSSDTSTIIPPPPTDLAALQSSLVSLKTQVASLSSQIQSLNELPSFIATPDAISLPAFTKSATLSGSLSVLGKTLLSNVGITGVVTDGLLTINGLDTTSGTSAATINTITSPLKLQSLGLAGLDILNGKITIDTDGNMKIQNTITAKKYAVDTSAPDGASAGKVIISKGKTTVDVSTTALTSNSLIFATPDTIPVAVAKKQISPDMFELTIAQPLTQDLRVDWWIVN